MAKRRPSSGAPPDLGRFGSCRVAYRMNSYDRDGNGAPASWKLPAFFGRGGFSLPGIGVGTSGRSASRWGAVAIVMSSAMR